MLAVVKTPRTEISLSGEGVSEILDFIRTRFPVQVIDVPQETEDDEFVNINDTDWWKNHKYRVLAGARLKVGMTQKRLAELTGVRQSIISEYENGKRRISRKAAEKFAVALETFPEKFLA